MGFIRTPEESNGKKRGRPKKNKMSSEILEKRRTLKFSDLAPSNNKEKENIEEIKENNTENNNYTKHWYPKHRLNKTLENKQYSDILDNKSDIKKAIDIPYMSKKDKIKDLSTKKDLFVGNTFEKGNVPRSAGRPPGSRNKSNIALEKIGADNAEAVVSKMVEKALEGDVNAGKIIMDRIYPIRKTTQVNLNFDGELDTIQDINNLLKHILRLVISGEMSTEEAEEYGKIMERNMKSITDAVAMEKIETTIHRVSMMSKRSQ